MCSVNRSALREYANIVREFHAGRMDGYAEAMQVSEAAVNLAVFLCLHYEHSTDITATQVIFVFYLSYHVFQDS